MVSFTFLLLLCAPHRISALSLLRTVSWVLGAALQKGASSCPSATARGSIQVEVAGEAPLQPLAAGVVVRRSYMLLCEGVCEDALLTPSGFVGYCSSFLPGRAGEDRSLGRKELSSGCRSRNWRGHFAVVFRQLNQTLNLELGTRSRKARDWERLGLTQEVTG